MLRRSLLVLWKSASAIGNAAWLWSIVGSTVAALFAGIVGFLAGLPPGILIGICIVVWLLALAIFITTLGRKEEGRRIQVLYRAAGERAGQEAEIVVQQICNQLRTQEGQPSASAYLSRLLESCAVAAVARDRTELARRLETWWKWGAGDALAAFYRAYQPLVIWMRDAGELIAYDFAEGNYAVWKQADEDFLRRLNDLLAETGDKNLRERILGHMWPAGGVRSYWA